MLVKIALQVHETIRGDGGDRKAEEACPCQWAVSPCCGATGADNNGDGVGGTHSPIMGDRLPLSTIGRRVL